jgi:hypothetical protein
MIDRGTCILVQKLVVFPWSKVISVCEYFDSVGPVVSAYNVIFLP